MTFAEFMQNVPIFFMLAGGVALVLFTYLLCKSH